MFVRSSLTVLLLVATTVARAEGAPAAPPTAATAVVLGTSGTLASQRAIVFRNPGTAALRLLLPGEREQAIACAPDGEHSHRSRPGQFLLAGGAELRCTAEPGSHRFTAFVAEGGAVRERSGKLVVR